jgi:hypothetical protein
MNWDLKTIGVVIVVFFVGYFIGLAEAYIKQKSKDNKKALEEKEASTVLPPPGLQVATTIPGLPLDQAGPEQPKTEPALIPPVTPASLVPPILDKTVKSGNSMVFQINEILQTHLAGTPLANQGIRLQEALHGGVLVYIGLEKYEGIDAVPNPEIKDLIRQSVAEWEKQA